MPLRVLQRAVALPYAIEDDRLRIAIADPRDLNAIDELRLASRKAIELAVAPRDDILMEIKPLSRASERYGAHNAVEAAVDEAVDEDELEAEASRTGRSFGSSTRSSSRRPRTARATSTSSRRRTVSSSGCASTAFSTSCSAFRGGWRSARRG